MVRHNWKFWLVQIRPAWPSWISDDITSATNNSSQTSQTYKGQSDTWWKYTLFPPTMTWKSLVYQNCRNSQHILSLYMLDSRISPKSWPPSPLLIPQPILSFKRLFHPNTGPPSPPPGGPPKRRSFGTRKPAKALAQACHAFGQTFQEVRVA